MLSLPKLEKSNDFSLFSQYYTANSQEELYLGRKLFAHVAVRD